MVVVLGLLLGSDSPKDYDDRIAPASLVGTWNLLRLTRNGQDDKAVEWNLVFRADTYSWVGTVQVDGTYKINTGRTPAELDLSPMVAPRQSKTSRCIFRIDGDTLLIALFEPETERPRSFGDKDIQTLTLQRVKK